MPGTFQEEGTPIDHEIVRELVELPPEWWKAVVLDVRFSDDGDVERYEHVILSPEGHKEAIDPQPSSSTRPIGSGRSSAVVAVTGRPQSM